MSRRLRNTGHLECILRGYLVQAIRRLANILLMTVLCYSKFYWHVCIYNMFTPFVYFRKKNAAANSLVLKDGGGVNFKPRDRHSSIPRLLSIYVFRYFERNWLELDSCYSVLSCCTGILVNFYFFIIGYNLFKANSSIFFFFFVHGVKSLFGIVSLIYSYIQRGIAFF